MERSQAPHISHRTDDIILIGLGANLPSPAGSPRDTLEAAIAQMPTYGMTPVKRSSWYQSTPVPFSAQPLFVNGVVQVISRLSAAEVLSALLSIEAQFGRVRAEANAARTLDLDLLDYRGRSFTEQDLIVPHPRMADRSFVLMPLAEILPEWRHPLLRQSAAELLAACQARSSGDLVERL